MHHGPEFTIILVFTLILAIGAATRFLSSRTGFPFTIAMLLLGTAAGLIIEKFGGAHGLFGLFHMSEGKNLVSPDLIIFVFLPALLFESSYDMDGHTFKKNLPVISILAGPAMLACTLLTAALMMWLAPVDWGWSWVAALTFGALISATDPVAVVAILKEVGAPKRLGTLIEGESLLNDGTAIVIFTVMLGLLTSGGAFEWGSTITRFFVVVTGGLAVGFVLSIIFSNWIGRIFNDPAVEITLTMVLGYLGMLVAEGMLHVSGVMAIVVSGLWMGGIGRTKISPEVHHFLHKFWGVLAYIANTIIFFLVGLVVATAIGRLDIHYLICIFSTYAGIMVIRFAVTFGMRPIFKSIGNPVSVADATVAAWGGLRGAVSLALALAIASNQQIPETLREQILVVTVGVVLLTILINGMTIGKLLAKFGLEKPPLAESLGIQSARVTALEEVQDHMEKLGAEKGLARLNWGPVKERLEKRQAANLAELESLEGEMALAGENEQIVRHWSEALNIEREAYWHAFSDGTVSAGAVNILNREIDNQLDRLTQGIVEPPRSRTADQNNLADKCSHALSRIFHFKTPQFNRLIMTYMLSRAEGTAAQIVLNRFGEIKGLEPTITASIKKTYETFLLDSHERVADMRENLPEVTQAIEMLIAKRVALNFERSAYDHLLHLGLLSEVRASSEIMRVETLMKALQFGSKKMPLPTTEKLLTEIPMFSFCADCSRVDLTQLIEEKVVARGETLFREGEQGDSMYVIARGAVQILKKIEDKETLLGVLSRGDIIGEMALLTGEPRNATVVASTTLTLLQITKEKFVPFIESHPEVLEEIWNAYGSHALDNHLRIDPLCASWSPEFRKNLNAQSRPQALAENERATPEPNDTHLFLIRGTLMVDDKTFDRPALVKIEPTQSITATEQTHIRWLGVQGASD